MAIDVRSPVDQRYVGSMTFSELPQYLVDPKMKVSEIVTPGVHKHELTTLDPLPQLLQVDPERPRIEHVVGRDVEDDDVVAVAERPPQHLETLAGLTSLAGREVTAGKGSITSAEEGMRVTDDEHVSLARNVHRLEHERVRRGPELPGGLQLGFQCASSREAE